MNGNTLRSYRAAANRSLESLAAEFGVHKTTILRWEARGVPVSRLGDVERVTGIPRRKLRPDIFEGAETEQEARP